MQACLQQPSQQLFCWAPGDFGGRSKNQRFDILPHQKKDATVQVKGLRIVRQIVEAHKGSVEFVKKEWEDGYAAEIHMQTDARNGVPGIWAEIIFLFSFLFEYFPWMRDNCFRCYCRS